MTYDDIVADSRYKDLVKRELETPLKNILTRTVDGLAKKLWAKAPKKFMKFMKEYDTTYDNYESISGYIENYFDENEYADMPDDLANELLDWSAAQTVLVFFPERDD